MCSCVSVMRWMSRKRGAISARVPGSGRGRAFAEQFDLQPALLFGLAQRGGLRVFVQLDVPAQRQPLVQVAMVDEQDLALVNDEDGDGEINFLVDVSHGWLIESVQVHTARSSHTARCRARSRRRRPCRLLRPGRP